MTFPTGNDTSDLSHLANKVMDTKVNGEFDVLNYEISNYKLETLNTILLVALLRYTWSVRKMLPFWTTLYITSFNIIAERGEDAKKLLRGLSLD